MLAAVAETLARASLLFRYLGDKGEISDIARRGPRPHMRTRGARRRTSRPSAIKSAFAHFSPFLGHAEEVLALVLALAVTLS
jgi:hypothetical protein